MPTAGTRGRRTADPGGRRTGGHPGGQADTPAGGGQVDTPAGATLQGGIRPCAMGEGGCGRGPIGEAGKMYQQPHATHTNAVNV
jgi:hypothetical protein